MNFAKEGVHRLAPYNPLEIIKHFDLKGFPVDIASTETKLTIPEMLEAICTHQILLSFLGQSWRTRTQFARRWLEETQQELLIVNLVRLLSITSTIFEHKTLGSI